MRAPTIPTWWRPVVGAGRPLPGLLLVAAIGLVAVAIEAGARLAFGVSSLVEALVIALLIGMVARNTVGLPARAAPGVALAGKHGLELAVVLLGVSLDVRRVLAAGPQVLAIILACVALALAVGTLAGRRLGLGLKLAVLVAVGTAICGNSAIAAAAPAIRADKKDIASAVALTAVVGAGLVLGLPWLVPLLHLSTLQYGVLVGTTVYAVPQVVAAAFPVSPVAGEVATVVKLVRVLLIGPVVIGLTLLFRSAADPATGRRALPAVPWFITGFVVLAALGSLGVFTATDRLLWLAPGTVSGVVKEAAKGLMILAMAALGLGVEMAAIRQVGPRVLATVLLSVVLLVVVSLGLILWLQPAAGA